MVSSNLIGRTPGIGLRAYGAERSRPVNAKQASGFHEAGASGAWRMLGYNTRNQRGIMKVMATALLALTGLLIATAQAADEPTGTLTLACEGTVTISTSEKSEPISMGIIVNFATKAVTGFAYPGVDTPVKITKFDDVHIAFYGSNTSRLNIISGVIDRVTGAVEATAEGPTFQKEFGVSRRTTR